MISSKKIYVDQPLLQVGCTLGEGPLYDARTNTLHFVDIVEKKVYHLDTESLGLEVKKYDESVTCLALRRDKPGLACAAVQGFASIEGGTLNYFAKPIPSSHRPHTRFNDGACDSKGRFFAGTVFSKEHGVPGQLYRFDPSDGSCEVVDDGPFTDSNGMGWSPDEQTFYFTDSLVNIIYAYDYDDGKLSNRRVFVDAIGLGFPEQTFCDGLCVDDEGGVWSARWGGSRVVRYTKDGEVDTEIVFRTALNVTACAFGGPNNDKLYVTSAHCGALGGDAARQTQFPDSGNIFVVDLSGQFRGVTRHAFAG